MRILIDIGHPAHVHYFRAFYCEMTSRGHEFLFVARQKEIAQDLLRGFGMPFYSRGKGRDSVLGKLAYMVYADLSVLRHALRFKPDLFLSFSSVYGSHVSTILRKPHVAFDDTEHASLARKMWAPFTDLVLVPTCFRGERTRKHIEFDGFMELLYLRPNVFEPDETKLRVAGIQPGERFSFVRFVSWKAGHDYGANGFTEARKRRLVAELLRFGRVVISSEAPLPEDLEQYRLRIDPLDVHHFLRYAAVFVGESATMASESAVLGTPAVYVDPVGRGYTDRLESEFHLVANFTTSEEDQDQAINRAIEFLENSDQGALEMKRRLLLNRTIDMNDFLIEIAETVFEQGRVDSPATYGKDKGRTTV